MQRSPETSRVRHPGPITGTVMVVVLTTVEVVVLWRPVVGVVSEVDVVVAVEVEVVVPRTRPQRRGDCSPPRESSDGLVDGRSGARVHPNAHCSLAFRHGGSPHGTPFTGRGGGERVPEEREASRS
jgi:hypothetical protein